MYEGIRFGVLPNTAQKWADLMLAEKKYIINCQFNVAVQDFDCFNEEILPDVLDSGSKICAYGANGANKVHSFQSTIKKKSVAVTQRWSSSLGAAGFPQAPGFLMCKLKGSETEAEFNTAARPGSCDQAGRRRSTFTRTQN